MKNFKNLNDPTNDVFFAFYVRDDKQMVSSVHYQTNYKEVMVKTESLDSVKLDFVNNLTPFTAYAMRNDAKCVIISFEKY